VARALLQGEQITDLRLPSAGGPPPSARRFWLHPTGGDGEELKAAYRMVRELSLPEDDPPAGQVRIEGWAELVATASTRLDPERVAALESKTVLAVDRLAGSAGEDEVLVLALRAHRLVEPFVVGEDMTGLPEDPGSLPAEPALSDVAFDARLTGLSGALPNGLERV
jgi:hypothetical protein